MDVLPEEWIDKIFYCMEKFYGERWNRQFKNKFDLDLYKTIWFNGLNGLSYSELKHGLAVSKRNSQIKGIKPPNVVIFYHYCINIIMPQLVPRRTPFTWKKS